MFQFPRFALKTLCIQVINNCFTPLLITPKCNNNKVSVGLPHSEIFGYSVYSRLPKAYRRVSRPSSPLTAKASTKRPSRAWSDPEIVRLFLKQKSSFFLRKLFISTYLSISTSFVLQLQKQHFILNSNVTFPWQEGHAHSSEWMLFRASLHVTVDLIHCDFG
jgi:hypothetical protein